MVIDDDPELREMLRYMLVQAHHEVLQAVDGLDGLRLAWHKQPELILLDVMMPALDGRQVLRRLKSLPETADIPVVLLTAVSAERHVQSLIAGGAADYVVKPFEPHVLLERVDKALARRAIQERESGRQAPERPAILLVARQGWEHSLLSRYLGAHGDVISAGDAAQAISAAHGRPPRAVLIGADLPDMPQADLVRRLRQDRTTADCYLVALVSQEANPPLRARLRGLGFDEVLVSPPSLQDVAEVMDRAMQPRASFSEVRDGVVVLVAVALDTATAVQRLRDVMTDFLESDLSRFVIDLSQLGAETAALQALAPFFHYLMGRGVSVRVVARDPALRQGGLDEEGSPEVFASVDEALAGWC